MALVKFLNVCREYQGREVLKNVSFELSAEFKGTIMVVSHDRYFLDKVVDQVAEVKDQRLKFYEGNFTHYWQSRVIEPAQIIGNGSRWRLI